MQKLLILILVGLLVRPAAPAQQLRDCKADLLDYLETASRMQKAPGKQPYFLHLSVTTIPAEGSPFRQVSLPDQNIEVKIYATAQRLAYESTHLAVYQDEKENLTVIHPRRLVIKGAVRRTLDGGHAQLDGQLVVLKKQLLELSTVKACREVTRNGQPVREIELLPNEKAQRAFHIKRLVYYYDAARRTVAEQIIEYTAGHRYQRQHITFHAVEPRYRGKLPALVADFLSGKRPVAERYRSSGYTLENE